MSERQVATTVHHGVVVECKVDEDGLKDVKIELDRWQDRIMSIDFGPAALARFNVDPQINDEVLMTIDWFYPTGVPLVLTCEVINAVDPIEEQPEG